LQDEHGVAKDAINCWKNCFKREGSTSTKVLWETFRTEFGANLCYLVREAPIVPEVQAFAALLGIDLKDSTQNQFVTTDAWNTVHTWFGPFSKSDIINQLTTMHTLVTQDWYFGDYNEQEANELLAYQSIGTFLVRYSQTSKKVFTVSWVEKDKVSKAPIVSHQRLSTVAATGLVNAIKSFKKKAGLNLACPGRPDIFANVPLKTKK